MSADQPTRDSRRGFLRVATLALGGAIGAVMAVPLVRYFLFPVGRKVVTGGDGPVDALDATTLVEGAAPVQVPIYAEAQRDAWTVREKVAVGSAWVSVEKGGKLVVFSSACPHLGCSIGYDPNTDAYRCPCHKSAFKRSGERAEGPSKRGLDPLPARIVEGRVQITFRRFRQDVAERTEV